ncbi:MAG: hypothetical protein AB8E15_00010 [Bdellovibrionales bacterium]
MKKMMFIVSFFVAHSSQASTFSDYAKGLKAQEPDKSNFIQVVADYSSYFTHFFEKAVRIGTSKQYINEAKIRTFNWILPRAKEECQEIDLGQCIDDIICSEQTDQPLNFHRKSFPCDY